MEAAEDVNVSTLKNQLSQIHFDWKEDLERSQSQLLEVKTCMKGSETDANKELDLLWRRVKTTATLLTYLKLKARVMAIPHLALTSCGIKQLDGVGLVDKDGVPLSGWSRKADLSSFNDVTEEMLIALNSQRSYRDDEDEDYINGLGRTVEMVSYVMEGLVKRVIIAESETATEKERVFVGEEELKLKVLQIENMSVKLEEMERFALGTNCSLNELRERVEDLVEETERQRQRASENEHELFRVKQDFECLKSYVSSLINVRETLLSSERQFQTIEKHFERLVAKTAQLETEKTQKETEVQKLMDENVRLSALLDKKEAHLLAMNEQCKVMALSRDQTM
ncbi:hypothetical protein Leryth_019289 [Lithospermum erythrorhizon]|nr:hypothetical protein Leryth_019289 [Lithospermum erythrorhizon]